MIAATPAPLEGLTPQIAVLGISIGLLISLVCYLITNLSPGGMITPGWVALVLVENPSHALLIGLTVVLTYLIMKRVQKLVILYGKRLFATVVMIAVFLQLTFFLVLVGNLPNIFENTTLGFIVPGLVAYQLIRQPIPATVTALVTVTALTYGIMLTGVILGLIPQATSAETFARAGGVGEIVGLDVVRLVATGIIAVVGLTLLALSLRRVHRTFGEDPEHPRA
ncbi:MAG: poly-gamma-glutamate biosynthesis protein PgsC/CapC [Actinomycetota bacterium]